MRKAIYGALLAAVPFSACGCVDGGWTGTLPPSAAVTRTVSDPGWTAARAEAILRSEDRSFAWVEGNGLVGWDCLKLDRSGEGTYVWSTRLPAGKDAWTTRWQQARVVAPPERMSELGNLLAGSGFFALGREYHSAVADGTVVAVRVRGNGDAKQVYCNNTFPAPVRRLADFVKNVTAEDSGYLRDISPATLEESQRIAGEVLGASN